MAGEQDMLPEPGAGSLAPVAAPPQVAVLPEPAAVAAPADVVAQPVVAPVVEPAAAAAAVGNALLTVEKPSLLESVGKEESKPAAKGEPAQADAAAAKPEAKPDTKPESAAAAKPAEGHTSPAAAFTPVEYKWDLPASITADTAYLGEFNAALNAAHLPAELGQEVGKTLLGIYDRATQDFARSYAEDLSARQHATFNDMRAGWNKDILADEVLGGAGHVTAMRAVARARDALVPAELTQPTIALADRNGNPLRDAQGNPVKISEFEQFLRVTGAGDHPIFMRILHNAARFVDEPQHADLPPNIRPTATNGRAPGNPLYDNPRSQQRS